MSIVRRLGRDTIVYGLSTVIARVASVALLPIYTRYLTPADYGLIQLLELSAEVASILFVAGSRAGMMRFYYRTSDERERHLVVSTAFVLEMSLALIATLALVALAHPVWRVMLASEGTPGLVRLAALSFFVGTLSNTPLTFMQTKQQAGVHTTALTLKLILQIVLNLYFLVVQGMGVKGMLLAGIAANAVFGLGTMIWMLSTTGLHVSWRVLRDLRRYGVPYQLTSAGGFVLTFGDRFFLQRFHGATQVGLYALAYQFGFLLYQMGTGPFLRAWLPERYKGNALPQNQKDRETKQGFLFLNLLLMTMATAIALGARPAIRLLTETSFHSAAWLVPFVLVAYVLHSWVEAVKFGIDVAEQTIYYTYASAWATLVVVVGYIVLIPTYGPLGAALATIAAFTVRFGLTLHWAQQLSPQEYGWHRVRLLALITTTAITFSLMIPAETLIVDLIQSVVLFSAYSLAVWRLVLAQDERTQLISFARARISSSSPSTVA